ncbi:metal-dependent hydrolase [Natronorubrum sp. JWXQ-INN-674]|uniref:Metal-dependent hydrolase n=1 Tax=Natronorubrum halalkaliphilum TaxID=2691917 RepID=A0A6B0VJ94_9EURY|nr:metal-dependent hydrolase [Natronorubrum halalkaliphilum]MXV61620.1 metal-dependent hydrolase [Natronorubrum halalkaliphilum]
MHRTGHYGAALIFYAPLGLLITLLINLEFAFVGGAGAVALSMIPDWDMKIPGIKHRGITHTIHFAVFVSALVGLGGFVLGVQSTLAAGLVLGGFAFAVSTVSLGSHIAADALTPAGVEPFLDDRHYSYDIARAANPIANYGLLAFGVLVTGLAVLTAGVLGL